MGNDIYWKKYVQKVVSDLLAHAGFALVFA